MYAEQFTIETPPFACREKSNYVNVHERDFPQADSFCVTALNLLSQLRDVFRLQTSDEPKSDGSSHGIRLDFHASPFGSLSQREGMQSCRQLEVIKNKRAPHT